MNKKHNWHKAVLSLGLILATSLSHARQEIQQVNASYVSSDYAQTRYPMVFSHGMAGYERLGSQQFGIDYWYQILPDLARNGAQVWATRVSPFNSTEVRGEQLLQQVEDILAISGAEKVNLIGHSQGGLTIRYVAGIMPEHVASLTTIGTPHQGSPVADYALTSEGTRLEKPLVRAMTFLSKALLWAQKLNPNQFPHDVLATGHSLSTLGAVEFNQKFPLGLPTLHCEEGPTEDAGIYFYSMSGTSTLTNILDPDSILAATGRLINLGKDNDGLVARCSAKFGQTIRDDFNWNHLDEVNQIMGLRSLMSPSPVDIYRQHANRLKLNGL
ncbi:triacylglycerol lipase [Acinetobacter calcoaceticus]|uniref:Triacylglycerol lipase n=1 Tax=Acinetobacter calcoaceticus TaxID=471 RepID=A0A4R1Y1H9_ACICA|nr:triacylglycerol lipase [Acinetobacter calcoaceticus]